MVSITALKQARCESKAHGVEELATLFTSPEASKRFRQIAELQSGSREAFMLAGRLIALATMNRSGKGE